MSVKVRDEGEQEGEGGKGEGKGVRVMGCSACHKTWHLYIKCLHLSPVRVLVRTQCRKVSHLGLTEIES